jgi:hypothetical protein
VIAKSIVEMIDQLGVRQRGRRKAPRDRREVLRDREQMGNTVSLVAVAF